MQSVDGVQSRVPWKQSIGMKIRTRAGPLLWCVHPDMLLTGWSNEFAWRHGVLHGVEQRAMTYENPCADAM